MRNFDHSVHALVSRQISRLLCHEYWLHGLQQTANNSAPPLRCAVSCLSFFPTVNSTFLTCRCCFHTLGINDRIAWTLLAFGICSHLFLQDAPVFCPTTRWFELGGKNCALLNTVESLEAAASIYTLNPPNAVPHLSILSCFIYSCALPHTVALFLTTVYLASR